MAQIDPRTADLIEAFARQQRQQGLRPVEVPLNPQGFQPPAVQGSSQSQMLAKLLQNPVQLPEGVAPGINKLQGAVQQAGISNILNQQKKDRADEISAMRRMGFTDASGRPLQF